MPVTATNSPHRFDAGRLYREQAAADLAEARFYFRLTLIIAAVTLGALAVQLFG